MTNLKHPPSGELLKKMNDQIVHRGPDDEGFYTDEICGLAMRRLSIVDLVTGHQPIHNEDQTVWVVLNGEIYNFPDLRASLQAKGHTFYTQTDTETIVHLYEEYGEGFVEHLWGMFGLALWDTKTRKLILARDRVGKKPLFYHETPDGIVFGSEIKSIIEDPRIERQLDPLALYHYLTLQYVPCPQTIYQGIKKLPPAHFLVWQDGQSRIERYWQAEMMPKTTGSYEEAQEELRELLADAVRIRMISDVPLGAFLSGGIDSSLIVGLMSRVSSIPVKTFTVCFAEDAFNEQPYARKIADMFGTEHEEIHMNPDPSSILDELAWHFDEPFGDYSAIPSYFVAKAARKHITVALNGDGGDDIFGGYERYFSPVKSFPYQLPGLNALAPLIIGCSEHLPSAKLRRGFQHLFDLTGRTNEAFYPRMSMTIFGHHHKQMALSKDFLHTLGRPDETETLLDAWMASCKSPARLDRCLRCDFNSYLPDDLLVKMDRMTMAHSLEGRSPLLDHRIVEFAARLPPDWKGIPGKGKRIIRETFPEILIPEIADRPKMGFGVPLGEWFRGPLKSELMDTVDSPSFHARGYFDPKEVKRMLKEHMAGTCSHHHRLWLLMMFERWHRRFMG
ncbi:MAG: asparagine synthase (glutamine-hydrolyzing) [Kiritimatiellia bacterium]|jgi:asparagine synthase (glutamine-hydrolysing)